MYTIYALRDPRDWQVRYVGLTEDVYERFRSHVYGQDGGQAKKAWIQELREANVMVIMDALESAIAEREQAEKREAYWIQHFYQLGARLTNQIIPLKQEIVYVRTELPQAEIRLGPRMTPDEQCQYIVKLWSIGLSKKTILAQVGKYIPRELVYATLAELWRNRRESSFPLASDSSIEIPAGENGKGNQFGPALQAKLGKIEGWEGKLVQLEQLLGSTQETIFRDIWDCRPGGSPAYKLAKAEYEVLMGVIRFKLLQLRQIEEE